MEDADRLRDQVLGEISRAETPEALEAIRLAAMKLPVRSKFVTAEDDV